MPVISNFYRSTAIVFVGLLIGACSLTQPTLQDTVELELAGPANTSLQIEAGAGRLVLEGDDGDSIRVKAEIYQTVASDDYRLELNSDGNQGARLIAETTSSGFGVSDYIDLSILVPSTVRISIDDGSGSMRIRNLGTSLDIDDGSGSLEISSVEGDITIDDGSGSLTIENVGGDVMIIDGSGSITVIDVAGTVSVDDGSGSITVRNAQDFRLLDDGSGSVNLSGIRN